MATRLIFEDSENTLECYSLQFLDSLIRISVENKNGVNITVLLDKQSAIKLTKVLKTEISKIV